MRLPRPVVMFRPGVRGMRAAVVDCDRSSRMDIMADLSLVLLSRAQRRHLLHLVARPREILLALTRLAASLLGAEGLTCSAPR